MPQHSAYIAAHLFTKSSARQPEELRMRRLAAPLLSSFQKTLQLRSAAHSPRAITRVFTEVIAEIS